jgi:hypothetical protein
MAPNNYTYTYNALFDFDKKTGLFEDPPTPLPANPLEASKCWLEDKGPGPTIVGPTKVKIKNKGHDVKIRVASKNVPPAAQVQIVACFGRPVNAPQQERASPFDLNSKTDHVETTFFLPLSPITAGGDWILSLGAIDKAPGDPKETHHYEFALGVIVEAKGEVRHYGEDPGMDIDM